MGTQGYIHEYHLAAMLFQKALCVQGLVVSRVEAAQKQYGWHPVTSAHLVPSAFTQQALG